MAAFGKPVGTKEWSHFSVEPRNSHVWFRLVTALPVRTVAQHGIEDHQELAHAGCDDDLGFLAGQPLGESGDAQGCTGSPQSVAM